MVECPVLQVLTFCLCVFSAVYTDFCPEEFVKVRYVYEHYNPFSLECGRSDLGPNVTYEWIKIDSETPGFDESKITVLGSTLQFRYLEEEQEGDYLCNIINNGTYIQLQIFVLRQIRIRGLRSAQQQLTYDFTQFTYAAIPCPLIRKAGDEAIVYTWYRAKSERDAEPVPNDSDEIYVDLNGTLHFTPIRIEDVTYNNGTIMLFVCAAFNPKLIRKIWGHDIYINVTEGTYGLQEPSLMYKSSDVIVARNKNATIDCVIFGYDGRSQLRYTWYGGKGLIEKNTFKFKLSFKNRRLTIINVNFEDAGTYKCVAENNSSMAGPYAIRVMVKCP